MFDRAIIDTDRFMDLPLSAKALYFLLGMEADDEGFVSYKKVTRIHGGAEDDTKILVAKGFLIGFPSGVVVITDWNTNNYLDVNRIRPTEYQTERKSLRLTGSKKYELNICSTSIVENSIVENSIVEAGSAIAETLLLKEIAEPQTQEPTTFDEWMKSKGYCLVDGPEVPNGSFPDVWGTEDGIRLRPNQLRALQKEHERLKPRTPTPTPVLAQNTSKLIDLISEELKNQYGAAPIFGKEDRQILGNLIKRQSFDFVKQYGKWFFRSEKIEKRYKYGVKAFASNDFINRFIAETGTKPNGTE